jgi:di/tricarboxylate transporter
VLVCALFGERAHGPGEEAARTPMSGAQKRLALILVASLGLWATDFLHGIQPGWVALAAGLMCILPRAGVMPLAALSERVKVGPVFYIAAVLGLGATLSETGLATRLTGVLNATFTPQPGADFTSFMALSLLASVAGLLTTNPVQPAVLAPLAGELAASMGWSVKAVLMTYAVGFTTLILPYQVPPVVVGLQVAGLRLRTALRLTLPLALVSLVALVPLNFIWWKSIGYLR